MLLIQLFIRLVLFSSEGHSEANCDIIHQTASVINRQIHMPSSSRVISMIGDWDELYSPNYKFHTFLDFTHFHEILSKSLVILLNVFIYANTNYCVALILSAIVYSWYYRTTWSTLKGKDAINSINYRLSHHQNCGMSQSLTTQIFIQYIFARLQSNFMS